MERVNYKALIASGEIKNFDQIVKKWRQEYVAIYQSRAWWPRYTPGAKDLELLGLYTKTGLEGELPFETFCLIWAETEESRKKDISI